MNHKSVAEIFQLPTAGGSFGDHAPWDPLDYVAATDNHPLLIVGFDMPAKHRIVTGIPRPKTSWPHMGIKLIPGVGEEPVCIGYVIACKAETLQNGKYEKANPHLKEVADEIFVPLRKMPLYLTPLHRNFWRWVDGQMLDERWRLSDSCFSIALTKDSQIDGVLRKIDEWKAAPPPYQSPGLTGKNCVDFVNDVFKGGKIETPIWWNPAPVGMPPYLSAVAETLSHTKGLFPASWSYQPRRVTQIMYANSVAGQARVQETLVPAGT
ncbi:MAG: hypothetical protein P4M15_03440 [Alphaproteobacteria bacterium]|nr:hypothetical protein [Alphaproteobacteria bacterium]